MKGTGSAMTDTRHLYQQPAPGSRMLRFRGDTVTFVLELSEPAEGAAWIRTNIDTGRTRRDPIGTFQVAEGS